MVKWLIKILGGVPRSAYIELLDKNNMLKAETENLGNELEAALALKITSGTDDLKDGISRLDTGKIYAVFNRGAMI